MRKITTLNNGLRIATDSMNDIESVAISFWVGAGSRNETKENNGISHFLEHMAFKGTENRTAKEIAEQFDNIGGKINAFTSKERTVYHAKVLQENIEEAFEIMADILQNSIFDKEELEKERGVILQEISMTNDTPDDIIFDYFSETAYKNQPYGRSILGPTTNIKNFQSSDLQNYMQHNYGFNNIVVAACGKINHQQIVDLSVKYLQKINNNKISQPEKAKYNGGEFRKAKDLEQTHLIIGLQGVHNQSDEHYAASVLALILGGGMSSRLFQEVREKRGLAYSIYSYSSCSYDTGTFCFYSATSPEKVNELIAAACGEIIKCAEDITEEELARAIMQFKASILMSKENVVSRANKMGSNLLTYNHIIDEQEIIKKLQNLKVNDIKKLMSKILFGGKNITFTALGKVNNIMSYEKICEKLAA